MVPGLHFFAEYGNNGPTNTLKQVFCKVIV